MSTSTAAPVRKTRDWEASSPPSESSHRHLLPGALLLDALVSSRPLNLENRLVAPPPSFDNYKAVFSEKNDFANGLINSWSSRSL